MDLDFDAFDEPAPVSKRRTSGGDGAAVANGLGGGAASGRPSDSGAAVPTKRARTDIVVQAPKLVGLAAARTGGDGAAPGADDTEYIDPTGKACKHEVAMPPGEKPTPEMIALTVPDDGRVPAREYKFELDPFQKAAVACIERDESVLVSAHTSAGKTVCAEYAIATSLRAAQRVLYTSPIKALSNQKYRELKEAFGDVGLMTGDVTIDVDASCLVMTTEILRSMLYRGSEVMREVKWVVFDEVHYMRDKERGVVWEEVMILLPHSVRYVMLSATVPNALEFAAWIAQLHSQPCHVVYTGYRPTPLMHYIFPQGGEGLYLTVDDKATFKADQFQKALAAIKPKPHAARGEDGGGGKKGGKGKGGGKGGGKGSDQPSDCYKLVQLLVSKGLEPVIIFAFGKAKCEALAGQMMMGKLQLNSAEETSMVETIFQNAIDTLTEEDQGLPQVLNLLPMLRRGIAVHHSGLLPVLKELVEILFAENLVKILCATETFAMGLNMPARTVLFAELSKYDGSETRYLTSGEYIQMSGRAGRRGLDARGIVVQMIDERTDAAKVREMLTGRADTLSSRFHLSYNMLLNCVRVETADVERLIQMSFYTFQQQAALPQLQARHKQLMARLATDETLQLDALEACTELHATLYSEAVLRDELRRLLHQPCYALPFMQAGRLVAVRAPLPPTTSAAGGELGTDWGWGVFLDFKRRERTGGVAPAPTAAPAEGKKRGKCQGGGGRGSGDRDGGGGAGSAGGYIDEYTVDVLLRCAPGAEEALAVEGGLARPPSAEDTLPAEAHILTVPLAHIDRFSSARIKLPPDLRPRDARHSVAKVLGEIESRFPDGLPCLAPLEDMKALEEDIPKLLRKIETVQARLAEPRLADPALHAQLPQLRARLAVAADERACRKHMREVEAVLMREELKGMRRVLRKLGHISEDGVIQNKGRVACEVSTADELLTTELVFSGMLNDLEPGALAALLSVLVAEGGAAKSAAGGRGGGSGGGGRGGRGGRGGGGGSAPDPASLIQCREMVEPFEKLREHARRVATAVEEAKLSIDVAAYVDNLSVSLIDVVVHWCRGAKFADVMEMAGQGMYEGSIIRTLHRLEELLRQLIDAAKVVGNEELEARCAAARKLLVRDVVFAASLYT